MPETRPLIAQDIPSVASMFQNILRKNKKSSAPSLQAYIKDIFLDVQDKHPELPSRVHINDQGQVTGFLGVMPMRMELNGRTLKAAVCGSFMVEAHESDPFAGARLLRSVLSGPQDLSFTETSNDLSTAMWAKMNAHALPGYSLEWLRVLRPAAFMVQATSLGVLRPLAKPVDAMLSRMGSKDQKNWICYKPMPEKADAFTDHDATEDEIAETIPLLLQPFALRPQWTAEELRIMLVHARRKSRHGERVQHIVKTRAGKTVGLFIYYGDAGHIGRVVQIMAQPGAEGIVLDRLLRQAYMRGMSALRGRVQPRLLDAMLGRKIGFVHAASTIVHTNQPDICNALTQGTAFINGFAGEGWTRLIGDDFE
jgi:hypothetical protein